MENVYDPSRLLALAAEHRLRAETATQPSLRASLLAEAARYEQIVRRSLEIPALIEPDA